MINFVFCMKKSQWRYIKMAISFNQQKGLLKKPLSAPFSTKMVTTLSVFVGDILARYVYWVKGENDKNIPLECLSFDRNAEAFNNKEKDWVREYYPDLKCGWSYATQCIDNGEVKVVNLKKKLWEQIITAAEDLAILPILKLDGISNLRELKLALFPTMWNTSYSL